jgi:hypothetical protein
MPSNVPGRRVVPAAALVVLQALAGCASSRPARVTAAPATAAPTRDGPHDFDFELGLWKTHLRRLQHPLTGSTTWVEYDGTTTVRPVWNGRANLVELAVSGPAGAIEGLSLRLYDPASRTWSLNFASIRGGGMSPPTIGGFDASGRGEFFGRETMDGKDVLVRFVISDIKPTSCRFEQAFSTDDGATWEVNWIAVDTRVAPAEAATPSAGD